MIYRINWDTNMEIIWKNFEDTDYIVSNTGIIINTRTNKTINQFPGGTGGYMMVNIWHNKNEQNYRCTSYSGRNIYSKSVK